MNIQKNKTAQQIATNGAFASNRRAAGLNCHWEFTPAPDKGTHRPTLSLRWSKIFFQS